MAITLARKHRGQGRRLQVPVGELPISTRAFSPTCRLVQECEAMERLGMRESVNTGFRCIQEGCALISNSETCVYE